jgi:hypothetical protein
MSCSAREAHFLNFLGLPMCAAIFSSASLALGAAAGLASAAASGASSSILTSAQGLYTLIHFSAHLDRFVWDRGCAYGLCSPC